MGINGLLKVLENIANDRHLSSYKGQRVAVDGYCWLHKAVYSLTEDILINPNSKKYLIYLIRRLEQLLKYNITPIIIFDGDKLPMKKQEEEERANHRKKVIQKTIMLLDQGLKKEAQAKIIEGIDISPLMAYEFIQELKKRNIEYYVAPYEADAQLAYLSKINYVDCIITEDSDLIALECKKILYKLDFENDMGKEIVYSDIKKCKEFSFELFDKTQFLTFCILSGCDYFKLKGVGVKNAYNSTKNQLSYKECLMLLRDKKDNVTKQTIIDFEKAFLSFKHQVIYCPITKKMQYMNSIEGSRHEFIYKFLNDLSFLGKIYEGDIIQQIVFGKIDPITHKPLILDSTKSTIGFPLKITSNTLREHFNINVNTIISNNTLKTHLKNNYKESSLHKEYGLLSLQNELKEKENGNQNLKIPKSSDEFLQNKRKRNIDYFDKEFCLDIDLDVKNHRNHRDSVNTNDLYHEKKHSPVKVSSESIISIQSSDSISNNNKLIQEKDSTKQNVDKEDNDSLNELDNFDVFLKSFTIINEKLKNGHLKNSGKIFLKGNIVSITEETENNKDTIREENKKKEKEIIDIPISNVNLNKGVKFISLFEQYKYNPEIN